MSGAGAASRGLLGAIAGPSRPLASSPASRASQLVARRCCFSTSSAACNSPPKPFRCYRYAIDVHGQLFLYDTKPKNFTSCFKNKEFLNFFIPRIKPLNTRDMQVVSEEYFTELLDDENWTDRNDLEGEIAAHVAAAQGYHYLSSCGPEYNFIRTADTPIVYRELTEDGTLIWAGDLRWPFYPSSLKVDPETGYVYHPSPISDLKYVRRRIDQGGPFNHPAGAYSLLSSALVLDRLASSLQLDPDKFAEGVGGSIEWKGERHRMGILGEEDIWRWRRYPVDDRSS